MLTLTPNGLYCKAGNFYIDPKGAVERAVITHAHSDHARRGAKQYYCANSGRSLLHARLGKNIKSQSYAFGEKFQLGGVTLSFHPAGHILGSSQVRMEYQGEVWVASGDYKRDPDPTCEPFEVVKCDTFVTEATFGTPAYIWNKEADLGKEIYEWWSANAAQGKNSVLFAYSLGKAQRVLGLLEPYATRQVICHSAATPLNECYREQGVKLTPTRCLSTIENNEHLEGELLLVPQSFLSTEQALILGDHYETAFASGWMATDHRGYDRGFLLSDHADWNDLLRTVQECGAKQVYVQHRGKGALVRELNRMGIKAFPETALMRPESRQLSLF
ncbi:MAG: ligase-associated DNA damage response exonuclease [Bdellovibrionales bacterium]|nr:ligase-associated DNA damage response exonuclease [Bdellovibrionales bacterium]